jgi:hypothetical protein
MSFDDVARRMNQRHSEGMVPTLEPLPPRTSAFSQSQYEVEAYEAERRAAKQRNVTIGALLMGLGLVITVATYSSASQSGGTYVIAYGPIIFGAIRLFRGLAG